MPPRKLRSVKKHTVTAATAAASSVSASKASGTPKHRCDGCTETISTSSDALNCSICHVWLHRYCAGIPTSRLTAIASSFVCSACSIAASASIVTELRSEIAALKVEVSELRAALGSTTGDISELKVTMSSTSQKLEKDIRAQVEDLMASQNAISNTRVSAIKRPQHRSKSRRADRPRHRPRPPQDRHSENGSETVNQRKPSIPVEGKRKLWGTRRTTSVSDITRLSTIYARTSIKSGLTVKRKFKIRQNPPQIVTRWWFMISGEENLLQQLQQEWPEITSSEEKWFFYAMIHKLLQILLVSQPHPQHQELIYPLTYPPMPILMKIDSYGGLWLSPKPYF